MKNQKSNYKKNILKQERGFTIIEMLVVIAIIATVAAMTTQIILSLIRSNNKTVIQNEVRQNGQFVLDTFERDARSAASASGSGANLTLTLSDGSTIPYSCSTATAVPTPTNGEIKKNVNNLINSDVINGVGVSSCAFSVLAASGSTLVTVDFTLTQAISAPNRSDLTLTQSFHTSVSLRTY